MKDKDNQENPISGRLRHFDLPDYWDSRLESELIAPIRNFCTGYQGDITVIIDEQDDKISLTCQKNGGD